MAGPAHHIRRAEADGLGIAIDIVFRRRAECALQRQTIMQGQGTERLVLMVDVDIVEIDIAFLEEAGIEVLELNFDVVP